MAFWTTLVNACWPHVCDMTKYISGAYKYLSQVPSPQISCPEMQNSSWVVEKNIFSPTAGWWNNHLQMKLYKNCRLFIRNSYLMGLLSFLERILWILLVLNFWVSRIMQRLFYYVRSMCFIMRPFFISLDWTKTAVSIE